jgi:predicted MPP superfamily phosphohydrolase
MNHLAARVFFLALALLLVGGMNVYLYRRLVRDVTADRRLRLAGGAALAAMVLGFPLLRFAIARSGGWGWVAFGLSGLLGMALYMLLFFLVLDVLVWSSMRVTGKPAPLTELPADPSGKPPPPIDESRRLFLSRTAAVGAVVSSGALVGVGANYALAPPEISEVPLFLPGLPKALEGFTIVQLSDIHIGPLIRERFVDQLVEVANRGKADLVAITGDLVDGTPGQLGDIVARFDKLRSRLGVYFCSGNHDYYSDWETWAPKLSGQGWNVLRNRYVTIGEPGASFDLVGVDDIGSRYSDGGHDLVSAVKGRDPDRPSVLLAHQPRGLDDAATHRIGLQLSGHTHGGQLFPGTLIGQLMWGARNAGLSRTGATQCYTSRGCGFVGPPVRLGAPPEVVKIVLLAG